MSKNNKRKFWSSFKASADGSQGDLYIYSGISSYESWWDDVVTPKNFKQELDALGEMNQINVYINSDGGDVFAGQAIHSMLKRHKAQVTVYIDGLAASIASVIAMAGDKIIMPRNAMMMVHKPWTVAMGNSNDLRKLADDLDVIEESLVAAYEDKTGLPRDRIVELLAAETWLTADESVEMGFANEIEVAKEIAASVNNGILTINGQRMDISMFKNAPKLMFAGVPSTKPEPSKPVSQWQKPLSLYQKKLQLQGRVLNR